MYSRDSRITGTDIKHKKPIKWRKKYILDMQARNDKENLIQNNRFPEKHWEDNSKSTSGDIGTNDYNTEGKHYHVENTNRHEYLK